MTKVDLQPSLTGDLIKLRPIREEDFDELFECAADPRVWEQHPQSDRYKLDVFEKFFQGALDSKGGFVVIDKVTGKIIGSSRYYDWDPEAKRITIGYTFLRCDYWGGKFNRELKTLMISHAFQFADEIFFEIGANNLRSRKAIEKIGAQLFKSAELDQKPHVVYKIDSRLFREALN